MRATLRSLSTLAKVLLLTGVLIAVFVLGIYVSATAIWQPKHETIEQSDMLLERLRSVKKLVTVEGDYLETYSFKDVWGIDYSPFTKRASVKVKATVLAGYNLNNISLVLDVETRTVVINNLPKAQILAIDHSIQFQNLQQGFFNSFTESDFTRINERSKNLIRIQAANSELMTRAEAEGRQILEVLELIATEAGWTVEIRTPDPMPLPG